MEDYMKDILTKIDLFQGISAQDIDFVTEHLNFTSYAAEQIICSEGEIGKEFFIILAGKVSVFKTDQKEKDCEIVKLDAGESFGEMSLIDEMARSASVSAVENTKVAVLTREALASMRQENLEVYSQILFNLAKEFSSRLRSMDEKYMKLIRFFF